MNTDKSKVDVMEILDSDDAVYVHRDDEEIPLNVEENTDPAKTSEGDVWVQENF